MQIISFTEEIFLSHNVRPYTFISAIESKYLHTYTFSNIFVAFSTLFLQTTIDTNTTTIEVHLTLLTFNLKHEKGIPLYL